MTKLQMIRDYYKRKSDRKARRKDNAEFISKTSGKKKKTVRALLVKGLDTLFSLFIRLRDKKIFGGICPFGCGRPAECAFHFITRSKHSVRWDPRNAVASCGGCNLRYEHDQTFVEEVFLWFKQRYGEKAWDQLRKDANRIARFSDDDLREIRTKTKTAIETVCI